ncbi:MAG TPA: hypothetical protein VLM89_05360 [Phycisphaerae bacterium]|nr:hypothetical protein [Phycisphaerae bacterium]
MRTIAHVTHEAVQKFGGIGAVLEGLLTSKPYQAAEQRTILIGPLFPGEDGAKGRLGPHGEVLYSSLDSLPPHPVGEALDRIRREFHVQIVYGHRTFNNLHTGAMVTAELLLIDVGRMSLHHVNMFKAGLWQHFGIDSRRYESSWDYDLYVKLAPPAIAALKALGAADANNPCVIVAHEFMGMPTALAGMMDPGGAFRTVFHAHEVASMRRIVESHPGQDITFYNVLSAAMAHDRYVDDVFGPQDGYYRHALVERSRFCDKLFAVGEPVAKELRFMSAGFREADITVTYNGIPAEEITLAEKLESRERMQDYAQTLLGDRPDYIFTHVTRTIASKALWRDIRVLARLEPLFRERNKSAVLFVLSTEVPARRPQDIREMEKWWHWPVAHREGDPDLSHGEAMFYQGVQEFNARSRMVKVVFVNQFGWDRIVCGERMPEDMSILDIRRGTDLEFGQSIYEPFGISQLEPLTYGAVCVPSSVCGCVGFVQQILGAETSPNIIVADYCDIGGEGRDEGGWLSFTREERERHEMRVAAGVARQIMQVLPATDAAMESLLRSGYELASGMSWDVVAGRFVMPEIVSACRKRPPASVTS